MEARQKQPQVAVAKAEDGGLVMCSSQCKWLMDLSNPHLRTQGETSAEHILLLTGSRGSYKVSVIRLSAIFSSSFQRPSRKQDLMYISIIEMYFEGSAQNDMS